jgi:arylsulfatase A-like enzyme
VGAQGPVRGFEETTRQGTALVVSALLALSACGGNNAYSPAAPTTNAPVIAATPPPPRVLIVSIDGLRPDALTKTESPNIEGLAKRGAYSFKAQTTLPSNTLPSHVSMLTGYLPATHKVTWDEYLPNRGRVAVPTIFAAARAIGKRAVMVAGKQKFTHFKDTGGLDAFILTSGGDDVCSNEAIVQLETADLMFVHFPDVDLTGHTLKWMSPEYKLRLSVVDRALGRLLSVIAPGTTVIVTSDHGGRDNGHGTSHVLDMTIPWIIAGPGIKSGYEITVPVTTVDTAATAAKIMGLSLPADIKGRVVTEAFVPATSRLP